MRLDWENVTDRWLTAIVATDVGEKGFDWASQGGMENSLGET